MKNQMEEYMVSTSEITRPIITRLRELVHRAIPEIEENMKWNAPSFELDGKIICSIMAFKKHVNLMFHQGKQLDDPDEVLENIGEKSNMKGLKQITELENLPKEGILLDFMKQAAKISEKR